MVSGRDRTRYRHKGQRKTVIKTVMGEVEYQRAMYEVRGTNSGKRFVYLLDEAMGKTGSGFMSGLLAEKIVQASCESTYRAAARSISELSGQSISFPSAVFCITSFSTGAWSSPTIVRSGALSRS